MLLLGVEMLYIHNFINENKLNHLRLATFLDVSKTYFNSKLYATTDFTIDELKKLKKHFIELGLLDETFDIGNFLNIVD